MAETKLTWRDVPGWFDWELLYDEVAATAPPGAILVEVGVAFGKSLLYLAEKVKEVGRPGVRIVAVDPWQPYEELWFAWNDRPDMPQGERDAFDAVQKHGSFFGAFIHNLHASGHADIVDVWRMNSFAGASVMEATQVNSRPHFVFIDAAHDYDSVRRDLDYWWDLRPEWMAGHDANPDSEVNYPGVWKAVDNKWGRENWEWRGQTCWVVRRSHLERPEARRQRVFAFEAFDDHD